MKRRPAAGVYGETLTSCVCSSMVIRDLTLRSAASFGSFHLIRLLYDEYMYFLIEHRVAKAKGETPIAVMGEVCVRGPAPLGVGLVFVDECPHLLLQFASSVKSRISPDLEKGKASSHGGTSGSHLVFITALLRQRKRRRTRTKRATRKVEIW